MSKTPVTLSLALVSFLFASATAIAQDHPGLLKLVATSSSESSGWDLFLSRMVEAGELRVRRVREDTMIAGRVHQRLAQFYKGIPVFGGELVRQWDGAQTVSVFGTLYEGIDVDPNPSQSPEAAQNLIEKLSGARSGATPLPQLVVLPKDDGGYVLAYRARVFAERDLKVYFIDAKTGVLLLQYSDLKRQAVGTAQGVLGDVKKISVKAQGNVFVADDELRPPSIITLDLKGNLDRAEALQENIARLTPSDLARDSDNNWTDGAVVDAHVYGGLVYDFFFKRFGRRGLDDDDIPIVNLVHPVYRADIFEYDDDVIGDYFTNALYVQNGMMIFGAGLPPGLTDLDGKRWNYPSGALDIVAHELAHGVTEFSSDLIYLNESGALNESFSDVMGTAVEFYYQPSGSGPQRADYLVGEDVITPGGLRSMSNPTAYGNPDHYSQRYRGRGDNGGVHINSGIPNLVYYLAVEGGTHRLSRVSVQGVGAANRTQIEAAFYRAFVFLLPRNATFSLARAATVRAARDLFGAGGSAERALTQAWTAVGVN